jgi:peptide/nickel transport system substrate-binding protein
MLTVTGNFQRTVLVSPLRPTLGEKGTQMSRQVRSARRHWRVVTTAGGAAVLAALVVVAIGVAATRSPSSLDRSAAHNCLVLAGSGDPAFTKNFNPYTATSQPSGAIIKGAFYEPLIITTAAGGGHQYPWLAQSWKWSNGGKTLTLNIRKGVKWSDGKTLNSTDVVYSLLAGRQNKVMDTIGFTRPDSNVASVQTKGTYKVAINLKTADSTFISVTLNGAFVVPRHIWSHVKDPSTFTNPTPVGSGPFDVVSSFTTQAYTFSKNSHYWLAGAPKIACIQYVQASSNDAALAQIQSGQVDWTHNFVPNVASAYESKDKAHFHSFYATTAFAQSLVFDDTQYPYSIVAFRKAVSLAIDRNSVSKLGEYGYGPPTDALGLTGVFPTWYTPALKKAAQAAATYNPTAAKALLTGAGFTYKGSQLIDPHGNAVKLDIHVISGWSDWVASDQIIAKNLQAIGIDSNEKLEPDWNSWYPNASATKFPTLLWQLAASGSPYGYFQANLSPAALTASGADSTATGNWAHYADPSSVSILNNWRTTLDPKQQQKDFVALANLFLKSQPIVPIYIGPRWSTYSTKYFHCFTSPKDFYTDPIFTTAPDNVVAFTRICPGGKAGA